MSGDTVSFAGLNEMRQAHGSDWSAACKRVINSDWYVLGDEVSSFESEFAAWLDNPVSVIGVASGTEALQLALMGLGVGPGDEVIVPSNALPTAYGVAATGATLRFADASLDDYCIDVADALSLVTPRTRAVVAVHLYGHPADVAGLQTQLSGANIAIVEDCAQAHGATIGNDAVGTVGTAGAWSFYPTKNLGALGDGGAVSTADPALAARVRRLRMYGETARYESAEVGLNSRLDEIQAAILRSKLPLLDSWSGRRRAVAAIYDRHLDGLESVKRPPNNGRGLHGRHLYPILASDRDDVATRMREASFPTAIHYPVGAHDQPCFAHFRERALPVTERLGSELLSLPIHPFVSHTAAERIATAVASVVQAT